jgi:hypothetical protein
MREVIKFRNLKERDCTTDAERYRVLPPHPSPLFAPRVARLRGKYWGAPRATVHGAAFSACKIPALIGETEGSAALVEYQKCS